MIAPQMDGIRMNKHYILIDYENVQTRSLSVLHGVPNQAFRVIIFVGANQSKIPIDLVSSMQSFGDKAEYVRITGSGRNALDFHIAYYLGALTERHPDGIFHVISKDTGYDQLIRHLKGKKIDAARQKDLFDIPWLSSANKKPENEQLAAVVRNLSARGSSRPRKLKTLKNSINSLFGNKLEAERIDNLVKDLKEQKYINVKQENVTYRNM